MMTSVSFGDMAQTYMLKRHQNQVRLEMQRASEELTTGKVGDPGIALRGDFRGLAGIDAVLARLDGYQSLTAEAGMRATALQTAVGTISAQAESSANALLSASTSGNRSQIDIVAHQAREDLRSTVAILNGSFAGRAMFAGTQSATTPLPDADAMLTAVVASFGPIASAADIVAAVDAWFAAPTGFSAMYQGGAAVSPLDIAPGETVDLDVRANDPVIQSTLRGQILAALLDTNLLNNDQTGRAALAMTAANSLLSSATERTGLAARIGVAEEKIDTAATRNAAERSALEIARGSLLAVDPYEAATRLEAAETQLKSIYSVTARLSRLSLVDYI
jgi:flagellar hook-associated protein 3 FlgL